MIVTRSEFQNVLTKLSAIQFKSFDTETTGLRPYNGDRLFSIIIGTQHEEFYFNFKDYPGLSKEFLLTKINLMSLGYLFEDKNAKWAAHNAKFDMAFLAVEGIEVTGEILCTQAQARLIDNTKLNYSLEALTGKKDTTVTEYIKKHKLYRVDTDANGEELKIPEYYKVPFEIISNYAMIDARITYDLAKKQVLELKAMDQKTVTGLKGVLNVAKNEAKITKTFFNMEREGIRVDIDYCHRAASHEQSRINAIEKQWKEKTSFDLVDSSLKLAVAFDQENEVYPVTEKTKRPSFTDEVLGDMKTPLASMLREYRDARKRANTYYKNFIKYSDSEGILHAFMKQSGTATGRISYADPNLQNLNKEEDSKEEFLIRRAFIPRKDYCFVMIDFDQMEYRVMLDYAKQMNVISDVLNGIDVHTSTAKLMSTSEKPVSRQQAKTLNFMLLYGGGVAKLAMALFDTTLPESVLKEVAHGHFHKAMGADTLSDNHGVSKDLILANIKELEKAQALKELYFQNLPDVQSFSQAVISKAKKGIVTNWAGRVYKFPNPEFAFKAPNYLIQGGCADIMKFAMPEIEKFLKAKRSRMIVQIHDELLFEIHESELGIVPEIKAMMESVYPYRKLPLTCGVEHSWKSWADKVDGLPK